MKPDSDDIYEEGQVIVVCDEKNGDRPALITNIGGDGSVKGDTTIHYSFINGDGTLSNHSGYFHSWQKGYKHLDFAKVWTMVKLPEDWEKRAIEYDKAQPKKSTLDDWDPEEHPSYGTVRIGHISGHTSLFMSPFRHQNYMSLSISRATKHRSLANDRTFSHRELIEVLFSEAQWGRLVSGAGMREGTPCTINHVAGQSMPDCPEQVEVEKFHADTKRYMEKSAACLDEAIKAVEALMDKPSVTKAERKELLGKLTAARKGLTDSLPFVATQIRERMEHIVSEGKTEIETFFHKTIQRLGLKQLQDKSPIELEIKQLPKVETKPVCNHGYTQPAACPQCVSSGATVEFDPEEGDEG